MRKAIITLSDEEIEALGYGELVSLVREQVFVTSSCWKATGEVASPK